MRYEDQRSIPITSFTPNQPLPRKNSPLAHSNTIALSLAARTHLRGPIISTFGLVSTFTAFPSAILCIPLSNVPTDAEPRRCPFEIAVAAAVERVDVVPLLASRAVEVDA